MLTLCLLQDRTCFISTGSCKIPQSDSGREPSPWFREHLDPASTRQGEWMGGCGHWSGALVNGDGQESITLCICLTSKDKGCVCVLSAPAHLLSQDREERFRGSKQL